MWVSWIKGIIALVFLTFLIGFVLPETLAPMLDIATAGQYATNTHVVRVNGYFNALTVENLTLIVGLAVIIFLIGRAVVERQIP